MQKNNKGVTLMALVVTLVVITILIGVSVASGDSNVKNVRRGRLITSMTLVKAKVQLIYEDYQFDQNTSLVGTLCQSLPIVISNDEKDIIQREISENFDNLEWYEWDKEDLKSQGLDDSMLEDGEYFYVNYENAEILFSKSTSGYYSLTGLKQIN